MNIVENTIREGITPIFNASMYSCNNEMVTHDELVEYLLNRMDIMHNAGNIVEKLQVIPEEQKSKVYAVYEDKKVLLAMVVICI